METIGGADRQEPLAARAECCGGHRVGCGPCACVPAGLR
jgi:hypothetical protein